MEEKIVCLKNGFVRLVDRMPTECPPGRNMEFAIVQAARVSYGQGVKDPQTDAGLIDYLYRNGHTSPFEMVKFKFHIKCPLFVARQMMRHRTANVNEFSQRYSEVPDTFYRPSEISPKECPGGGIRYQDQRNKQGSVGTDNTAAADAVGENDFVRDTFCDIERKLEEVFSLYKELIDNGVSREVARFCLPTATYTEFYFCIDLHNLLKLLKLRMDAHAQPEIQVYANAMHDLIAPHVPNVMKCFNEYTTGSVCLSRNEIEVFTGKKTVESLGSKRKQEEYRHKIDQFEN